MTKAPNMTATEKSSAASSQIIYYLLFVLLGVVLLGVQLHLFSGNNYREDEAWVIHGILQKTPTEIVQWTSAGVHPPGWLLIVNAWIEIFGPDENITRILSTLFTAITLAFTFRPSRDIMPRLSGFVAVLLLGSAPFVLFYSHELRPYALLLACSVGMQVAFLRWLRKPTFKPALIYVSIAVLGVYAHYFATYVVLAQAIFVLLFVRNRIIQLKAFGLFAAVALSLLGWVLPILNSFTQSYSGGIYYALPTNVAGLQQLHALMQIRPIPIGIFLTLLAIFAPYASKRRNRQTDADDGMLRTSWRKWYALTLFMAILLISMGINLGIRNVTPRNLIIIMPLLAFIGTMGIFSLPSRARIIILFMIPVASLASYQRLHPALPYQEMTAYISETYQPDSVIITEVNPAWRWLLTIPYYFMDRLPGGASKENMAHLIEPAEEQVFYSAQPDQPDNLVNFINDTTPESVAMLDQVTGESEQLWYVQAGEETSLQADMLDWLRLRYFPIRDEAWTEGYPLTYTVTEYRRLPENAQAMFTFDNTVSVLSWSLLDDVNVTTCQSIFVESWWANNHVPDQDYSMTLVIANQAGNGVSQSDGAPAGISMQGWEPDRVYFDQRNVQIPCDLEEGAYYLLIGVYEPATLENLLATSPDGSQIGALVYLTTLNVVEN